MWVYRKDQQGRVVSGVDLDGGEYAVPFTNGQTGEIELVYRSVRTNDPSTASADEGKTHD